MCVCHENHSASLIWILNSIECEQEIKETSLIILSLSVPYSIMILFSTHNLAITNTRRGLWMIIWCEIINVWSDILLISMVLIMTHSFSSCQWLDIFSRVVNTFSGHYSILLLIIHLLNIKRSPLPAENKPKIKLNLLAVLLDTFICKEKKRLMSKKLFHVIKLSHRKIK